MAAVADGAGSAALGEVGAAVAAHAGVEKLYSQLTQPLGPQDDKAWHSLLTEPRPTPASVEGRTSHPRWGVMKRVGAHTESMTWREMYGSG